MTKHLYTLILLSCLFYNSGIAQNPTTLHMGDPAPKLTYHKWIKGNPVDITGDKIYVVEFWATWCGPCKEMMPHLSMLAKRYKGQVEFIGTNVLEVIEDNKQYESVLPNVVKFVNNPDNHMEYNVIMDNNNKEMVQNWLHASGQMGIPVSYLIKDNKVMWIGPPILLETIIKQLLSNTYDLESTKKEVERESTELREMANANKEALKAFNSAMAIKDYKSAIDSADLYIIKRPYCAPFMRSKKFDLLLNHFSEKQAVDYMKEVLAGNYQENYAIIFTNTIVRNEGLSKELYLFAVNSIQKQNQKNFFSYSQIATAYYKAGNKVAAIDNQKKAIEMAKAEIENKNENRNLPVNVLSDLQNKLALYEKM